MLGPAGAIPALVRLYQATTDNRKTTAEYKKWLDIVNQLIGETGEHQPKVAKQGEITFHVMQVGAETARKLEEELSKAGREAGRFIEPWSKLRAETDKYRETLVRLDT